LLLENVNSEFSEQTHVLKFLDCDMQISFILKDKHSIILKKWYQGTGLEMIWCFSFQRKIKEMLYMQQQFSLLFNGI